MKTFDAGKILEKLGACPERSQEYTGLTLKQAWNKIDNLPDFEWVFSRLKWYGNKTTKEYYKRAHYATIAVMIEEAPKNQEYLDADNEYIDLLNSISSGKIPIPNEGQLSEIVSRSGAGSINGCGYIGCWYCAKLYCAGAIKKVVNNIRRVVIMPTEKEILACCKDWT